MIPLPIIAAGIAATVAFAAGWKVRDWQADSEELSRQTQASQFLARNMVSRQLSEQALQAVETKSAKALQDALNVNRKPLYCQPNVNLYDVELPDLGKRLRDIRNSAGQPSGSGVEAVRPANPR